jgi:hypothetical protein
MSDDLGPFERAVKVGLQVTRNAGGVPVTYSRGATTLSISSALQGRTNKTSIDVGGEEQVVEMQQWLIAVEDLRSLAPPQSGDLITRNIGGTDYVFTVEAMTIGEVAWDWSDVAKSQYDITTRKDGSAAYEVSEPTGFDISGNELRYD